VYNILARAATLPSDYLADMLDLDKALPTV
jgi:hypothetical protein